MNYHFVGIKGSGMSALACILADLGENVSGSDISNPVFTESSLAKRNIYAKEFNINNLSDKDVIIIGNAFNDSNVEVKYAYDNNLNCMRYFEFIDQFSKKYTSIAIAGTNGKTTTTGLLTSMLSDSNIVSLIGDGTGFANENAEYFIFEACEYKETFLNYNPEISVINNIEMDHPDFFRDIAHVIEVFQKLANKSKVLIINGDDENCQKITHLNKLTFGLNESNDLYLTNLEVSSNYYTFDLIYNNTNLGNFTLNFVGMHMINNALASIAVGLYLGFDINVLIDNINQFKGAKRRFETDILNDDVVLIDDYAHHPTAIDLVIDAIKQKYPDYKLSILFQPHTYSRTVEFLDEFATSLSKCDNLFLADIFGSARESNTDITIDILIEACANKGIVSKKDIEFLKDVDGKHVIAMLGAGDIDQLYKQKIKDMF